MAVTEISQLWVRREVEEFSGSSQEVLSEHNVGQPEAVRIQSCNCCRRFWQPLGHRGQGAELLLQGGGSSVCFQKWLLGRIRQLFCIGNSSHCVLLRWIPSASWLRYGARKKELSCWPGSSMIKAVLHTTSTQKNGLVWLFSHGKCAWELLP